MNISKTHILIVDDEPDILQAFERMLTNEGHDVECTTSAEDALDRLQAAHDHAAGEKADEVCSLGQRERFLVRRVGAQGKAAHRGNIAVRSAHGVLARFIAIGPADLDFKEAARCHRFWGWRWKLEDRRWELGKPIPSSLPSFIFLFIVSVQNLPFFHLPSSISGNRQPPSARRGRLRAAAGGRIPVSRHRLDRQARHQLGELRHAGSEFVLALPGQFFHEGFALAADL